MAARTAALSKEALAIAAQQTATRATKAASSCWQPEHGSWSHYLNGADRPARPLSDSEARERRARYDRSMRKQGVLRKALGEVREARLEAAAAQREAEAYAEYARVSLLRWSHAWRRHIKQRQMRVLRRCGARRMHIGSAATLMAVCTMTDGGMRGRRGGRRHRAWDAMGIRCPKECSLPCLL